MQPNYKTTLRVCSLAYITQAIVVNLVPLFFVIFRSDYGISYAFLAGVVLYTFVVQILVDLASVRLVSRVGYRTLSVLSQITSAAGLIMLTLLPIVMRSFQAALVISVTFYSIGGGLAEVVISPICDALPTDDSKAGSMSFLHSFYSWGQVLVILVTTAALSLIGDARWQLIPLVWSVVPIVNIVGFLKAPIPEVTAQKAGGILEMLKSPVFISAMVLMICSGASEQVMAQWSSMFAERGLGISKVAGDLFGPCLFAAFMGLGRTAYGVIGDRLNITKALLLGSLLTVASYIMAVFSPWAPLSLAGCALSGLGVSILWPGMLSYSARRYPAGGGAMFALLALGGDIGCSVGPWLSGLVSDRVLVADGASFISKCVALDAEQLGLRCGILAGIVFPVIMAAAMAVIVLKKQKQSQD